MGKRFTEKFEELQGISMLRNSQDVPCALWLRSSRKMCTLIVTFKDGVAHEGDEEWGYAHFLQQLHFKQNNSLVENQGPINLVEEIGGKVMTCSTRDTVSYMVTVPSWEVKRGFKALKTILLDKKIEEQDVELNKTVLLEWIHQQRQNPGKINKQFLEECLLSPHPIGRRAIGSIHTVGKGTAEKLMAYKKERYCIQNLMLTILGDFDKKELSHEVEQFLTGFDKGTVKSEKSSLDGDNRTLKVKGKSYVLNYPYAMQTHLSMGWRLPKLDERGHVAWQLLNSMIGAGLSTNMFQSLRAGFGPTGVARLQLKPYSEFGTWCIHTHAFDELVPQTLDHMQNIFSEVMTKGIKTEHLEDIKKACWGSMQSEFDDGLNGARWIVQHLNLFGNVNFLVDYGQHMASVMEEEILSLIELDLVWEDRVTCLSGNRDKICSYMHDVEVKRVDDFAG